MEVTQLMLVNIFGVFYDFFSKILHMCNIVRFLKIDVILSVFLKILPAEYCLFGTVVLHLLQQTHLDKSKSKKK